ncbi:MAG: hypothetical protein ACREQA_21235 [Candidatus Binatia bacterium]
MVSIFFQSAIGKTVELTDERRGHILRFHPDVGPFLDRIGEALAHPDALRRSSQDSQVALFYKFYADILEGKYIVVVVKQNERSFILTVYLSNNIRTGVAL